MASIEKKVGRFTVNTWTDCWPMWVSIEDDKGAKIYNLLPEEVRDLIYSLERVMAQIEPMTKKDGK